MATNPNITHFPVPPTQSLPPQGRPLARKLALVLADVHRVPKNGRNDFHKYDYVYEADLVDHIRDKLAEHGIAIFPSVAAHSVEEMQDNRNRTSFLTTVTLDVTLIDGESGDMLTTTWVGQGMDSGDKGYYKAYTGAIKYFLLKTFLISTGDDPELDEPSEPVQRARPHTSAKPKSTEQPAPADAAPSSPRPSEQDRWKERSAEFTALLEEAVEDEDQRAFEALYVKRMGASSLKEIDAQKIGAMCRKLRGMNPDARKTYVEGVIGENE